MRMGMGMACNPRPSSTPHTPCSNPTQPSPPASTHPTPPGKPLVEFPEATVIPTKDLLTVPCDVLVPAAIGGVIDETNAGLLQCKFVVEAANGPTTPEVRVGDGVRLLRLRFEIVSFGALDSWWLLSLKHASSRETGATDLTPNNPSPAPITPPPPPKKRATPSCGSAASQCCPTSTPTPAA
jgi:hypothetical protein